MKIMKISILALIVIVGSSVASAVPARTVGTGGQETVRAPPPLTAQQKSTLKEVIRLNKLASAGVAVRVARIAKEIYANLLADHPNARTGRALSAKLHRTTGELLTLHGQAVEQRHYVRDQMGKPDMPADLLELIVKIYELEK